MNAPMHPIIATIRSQEDLIEALRAAKGQRGLSNDFCDERGGLTRGHTDKVLGPARAKSLTGMTFDLFLEMFAVQLLLVPNAEAEQRMAAKWEGRDTSNVRTGEHRVSKAVLERAKPHVLKDFAKAGGKASGAQRTGSLGSEIMRRLGKRSARKRRKTMSQRLLERKLQQPLQIDGGAAG